MFVCIKMNLALKNLQWLMFHETKPNQTKPNPYQLLSTLLDSKKRLRKIFHRCLEDPRKQKSYSINCRSPIGNTLATQFFFCVWVWPLKKRYPNNIRENEKITPVYNNISNRCILSLEEKMVIITFPNQQNPLNEKSKRIIKCRHTNKFLLCSLPLHYNLNDLKKLNDH